MTPRCLTQEENSLTLLAMKSLLTITFAYFKKFKRKRIKQYLIDKYSLDLVPSMLPNSVFVGFNNLGNTASWKSNKLKKSSIKEPFPNTTNSFNSLKVGLTVEARNVVKAR
ncbi:hypothetical protein WICPIJ_009051 [Wickerhamomyces pijperi]|uniref:Uncharacterized protein n=1 Tax=Wickerhamomyces pijperi TaxID=599730 RepID=A0A9P8TFB8_WICPI|nr:hypothetical protein WICPIJ_009051 [Wickerhamomyces pijperi]